MFQKRSEYQEALSLPVPQARPDDQILRCCLQQQLRMSQARCSDPTRASTGALLWARQCRERRQTTVCCLLRRSTSGRPSTPRMHDTAIPPSQRLNLISSTRCLYRAQGIVEHETRALVLLSNDNGLLQDAELAWDVRGSPLRSFPWQVQRVPHSCASLSCASLEPWEG